MRILTYWSMMAVLIGSAGLAARIAWQQALRRSMMNLEGRVEPEVERYDAAAGERWLEEARRTARALAETGDVTTDDLWRVCPPPRNVDGRLVAKAFDRSEWEIVGYRHSERGRNNARQIAIWRRKPS